MREHWPILGAIYAAAAASCCFQNDLECYRHFHLPEMKGQGDRSWTACGSDPCNLQNGDYDSTTIMYFRGLGWYVQTAHFRKHQ